MLKLTNFVTRPMAAVAAIALLGLTLGSAQAVIVQVDTLDETSDIAFTVSSTDLIEGGASTLASQSTSPDPLQFGGGTFLNDGDMGTSMSLDTTAAHIGEAWSATFELDTSTNTLGYDITGVTTYAGWEGLGNADQNYELFVSVVGDDSFTSLGTIAYDIVPNGSFRSTRVELTDDTGTLATGVDAFRFDIPALGGGDTGVFREFDVFGTATIPEPSSVAMMALGLVGLVSLRKRNRC